MKVALVVQRYGARGARRGAETLARRAAELIAPEVDLTVLTTCALDYLTWADHYPPGADEVNGVHVLRFPVSAPRDPLAFEQASARAYASPHNLERGRAWMQAQGPNAPGLLEHLRDAGSCDTTRSSSSPISTRRRRTGSRSSPTGRSSCRRCTTSRRCGSRSSTRSSRRRASVSSPLPRNASSAGSASVVPDERARSSVQESTSIRTPTRLRFVQETGHRAALRPLPRPARSIEGRTRAVEHHLRYRAQLGRTASTWSLSAAGTSNCRPTHGFHRLGFVSEELKHDAIAGAEVVVCPSPYESLSFSQLEAWSHGRPTLANAASPVLVGQSRRSGGGLWYSNAQGVRGRCSTCWPRAKPLADAIGAQGRRYAEAEYSWDRVREHWLSALAQVAANG